MVEEVKNEGFKYCMYCGREIPLDANFCPGCGRSLASYAVPPKPALVKPARPSEATVVVALLFLDGVGWMTLSLLWGAFLTFLSPSLGAGIFVIGVIVGLIIWGIAGGLLTMQKWAYTAALIFACISLFAFPVGTVIGIISVWLLLKENVKRAYGKL